MKNFVLFILLCLLAMRADATSKEDSIRQYYSYVLEAEHNCIKNQYNAAADLYVKAFEYKSPFACDVYNSLLCAIVLKDHTTALDRCERLVQKGSPLAFFDQALFATFRNTSEYQHLKARFSALHKQYLATTDQEIIKYIDKLIAIDQNVHCALPVKHEDAAFVESMHGNDDSLASILVGLMQEKGNLGEDVLGVRFESDTIIDTHPYYGVIALHQLQRGGSILTEAIKKAMKDGDLRSETGIGWLSQSMLTKVNLIRPYMIITDTLWKKHFSKSEAELNKHFLGEMNDELRQKTLAEVYLDNKYFDVEERVVYNFDAGVHVGGNVFRIEPAAIISGSIKEGHEAEFMKYIHETYEVLAVK